MNVNEEQLVFYEALGRAITGWAHVEHSLVEVLYVIDTPDRQACRDFQEFSRAGSFRQQLELVNGAVVKSVRHPEHVQAWRTVRKRCERTYARRNALAHHFVMNYPNAPPGRRLALVQWRTLRTDRPGSDALCVRNIYACAYAFSALYHTLHNLSLLLRGKPKLYTEDMEKPRQMPTLAYVRADLSGLLRSAQLVQPD